MKYNCIARAASIVALCVTSTSYAQVVVVVNPKNPAASMSADQVSSIFMGKANTLPSGAIAVPVDLPDSAATRETFYTKVAGKSAAQVKAAWSRLMFSGKATPPKELASAAEVKKFVGANPDAIGYIETSAVDSTVKVVLKVE
jgi:ABC-type phosphate transport system substrate-binding protein